MAIFLGILALSSLLIIGFRSKMDSMNIAIAAETPSVVSASTADVAAKKSDVFVQVAVPLIISMIVQYVTIAVLIVGFLSFSLWSTGNNTIRSKDNDNLNLTTIVFAGFACAFYIISFLLSGILDVAGSPQEVKTYAGMWIDISTQVFLLITSCLLFYLTVMSIKSQQ